MPFPDPVSQQLPLLLCPETTTGMTLVGDFPGHIVYTFATVRGWIAPPEKGTLKSQPWHLIMWPYLVIRSLHRGSSSNEVIKVSSNSCDCHLHQKGNVDTDIHRGRSWWRDAGRTPCKTSYPAARQGTSGVPEAERGKVRIHPLRVSEPDPAHTWNSDFQASGTVRQ